jgi:hypothetical protein
LFVGATNAPRNAQEAIDDFARDSDGFEGSRTGTPYEIVSTLPVV